MSWATIAPAPIIEPSPIFLPGRIIELAPRKTFLSILILAKESFFLKPFSENL